MPRRPAARFVRYALVAVLAFAAAPVRADEAAQEAPSTERHTLRVELGPEIDTNAHRSEVVHVPGVVNEPAVVSPLARSVLAASVSDVIGANQQVALSATAAAKVFTRDEARGEDVGILEATALWRTPIGAR